MHYRNITIDELLACCETAQKVLRDSDLSALNRLIFSRENALIQLKSHLASKLSAKERSSIKTGLRQSLREFPELLASLVPLDADILIVEIERRIGRRLSEF